MIINRITVTGADNGVSGYVIEKLLHTYPFLELGILLSPVREGTPRYPSEKWIRVVQNDLSRVSWHLCGKYSRDFLVGVDSVLPKYIKDGDRVQINCNLAYGEKDYAKMVQLFKKYPNNQFIIPLLEDRNHAFGVSMIKLNADIVGAENMNFLYDESKGKGIVINKILPPVPKFYTGYAGGLTPDNVVYVAEMVTNAVGDLFSPPLRKREVWLDVESGVRIDNEFSYTKTRLLLDRVAQFIL